MVKRNDSMPRSRVLVLGVDADTWQLSLELLQALERYGSLCKMLVEWWFNDEECCDSLIRNRIIVVYWWFFMIQWMEWDTHRYPIFRQNHMERCGKLMVKTQGWSTNGGFSTCKRLQEGNYDKPSGNWTWQRKISPFMGKYGRKRGDFPLRGSMWDFAVLLGWWLDGDAEDWKFKTEMGCPVATFKAGSIIHLSGRQA